MKYALVDGKKAEATKGAKGFCRSCGSELTPRCGERKAHHWAHKGTRNCDPWWENETEWHRSWKSHFPVNWQEVVQFAEDGEKHIADVKTENGRVIEFQHSYLNPEERRSRDAFYPKLVWVVDGLRRQRDKKQLDRAIENSKTISRNPPIQEVLYPDECKLLEEWMESSAPVFFDFQGTEESEQSPLWLLVPVNLNARAYLIQFSRDKFIQFHIDGMFDECIKSAISSTLDSIARNTPSIVYSRSNRLPGFQKYLNRMRRNRRRF